MYPADKSKLYLIRKTLEDHHRNVVKQFHEKHAEVLKFAKKQSLTLAGAAILTAATLGTAHAFAYEQLKNKQQQEMQSLESFIKQIGSIISDKKTLNPQEEQVIADALSKKFGLDLKASLDGNQLNEIYGYMGAEQHLYRWAGDTLAQHQLQQAGMAPLQGAFKNFETADQEKYYVAVQLHEIPGWNKNWPTLKPWYQYRKVFVYNPATQKGIVAVIGDSGPGKFTGKTFGGSPEVMDYLQMKDGSQKGRAIILFVDDKENKIALGPVNAVSKFLAVK
jgi:hypothetical protein